MRRLPGVSPRASAARSAVSRRSSTVFWMLGRIASMPRPVKLGCTSLRMRVWSGGSMEMMLRAKGRNSSGVSSCSRCSADHTRIRKLVQPSFTGRGMEAMRPSIQKTVDDLLEMAERDAEDRDETPGNRRIELVSQFAYPFPVTVISDLLGIPREDREQIRGWT